MNIQSVELVFHLLQTFSISIFEGIMLVHDCSRSQTLLNQSNFKRSVNKTESNQILGSGKLWRRMDLHRDAFYCVFF